MVDNLYDYKTADRKLSLGMDVYACWTNDGFHHREKAIVVKLDKKSVTVQLHRTGGEAKEFPAAKKIELPRFNDQTRWSWRNCVWPMGMDFRLRKN